jgi:hypothetical protein
VTNRYGYTDANPAPGCRAEGRRNPEAKRRPGQCFGNPDIRAADTLVGFADRA